MLATADLVKGKTIGIDATTLEANAALRSIVRRDSGETYHDFLTRLAQASGIETPTRAELARFDRKRPKKGRNKEWRHPHDPDARITKMKDGRTHLAHKAEHAVDMETGAIVGVTVQGADQGDTTTIAETVTAAAEDLEAVAAATDGRDGGDRGGRGRQGLPQQSGAGGSGGARSAHLHRGTGSRPAQLEEEGGGARRGVCESPADPRRAGHALQRQRSERLERPNAHLYETGGMRRTHLRGHTNILKRLLVHVGGFNLGLFMRTLFGVGTPRSLQGRMAAVLAPIIALWTHAVGPWRDRADAIRRFARCHSRRIVVSSCYQSAHQTEAFSHGLLGPGQP